VATALADGPIDVVINNAGIMPVGLTEAFSMEQVRSCFDVNLFGAISVTKAVLPSMRDQKSGLIINLSSSAGRLSIPYFGLYCASKWALETWVESLNYELEPFGVESVLVEPSGHGTDLVNTAPAPSDRECVHRYASLADGREKLLDMFHDTFRQQDNITDADNVAKEICRLI
jgi:short-subunit dehydrogenase